MKFAFRPTYFIILLIALAQFAPAQDQSWQPVAETELQMKTPQVERDADAEVLFWEVRMTDEYFQRSGWQSVLTHHLRIKIFTEQGKASAGGLLEGTRQKRVRVS